MLISKLASAIRNDVVSGLRGYHSNMSMNLEQLEDDIIDTRLQIIKEYSIKGILPVKDLLVNLNCIPVDCDNLEKCTCGMSTEDLTPTLHFQIPQLVNDFGEQSIQYVGSTDKLNPFIYYTTLTQLRLHKYKSRNRNKPYVWINTAPNDKGFLDCYVFNAPMLKNVSVIAIFKDPRQLEVYGCCEALQDENVSFIDNEIKKRLVQQKLYYYRQLAVPITPNDQSYNAG